MLRYIAGIQIVSWYNATYVCRSHRPELRAACPQVFLVGAAYVSKEAANETKEVITTIQPRCVLLELDKVGQHFAGLSLCSQSLDKYGDWAMSFLDVLQERLKDLEESLKSGDVYNERILELPKRKVNAVIQQCLHDRRLVSTANHQPQT